MYFTVDSQMPIASLIASTIYILACTVPRDEFSLLHPTTDDQKNIKDFEARSHNFTHNTLLLKNKQRNKLEQYIS